MMMMMMMRGIDDRTFKQVMSFAYAVLLDFVLTGQN